MSAPPTTRDPIDVPVTHEFVQVNQDIRLHYVTAGPKDGLPVVLVHGWPDLWIGWRYQIEALSAKYRVFAVDLRGFGQSSAPSELSAYGNKNLTNDLVALLDASNIEKAIFLGHDWGGVSVWRMALYHPDRVLALGGVCTPYIPASDVFRGLDDICKVMPVFEYQQIMVDSIRTSKLLDANRERLFTAIYRNHDDPANIQILPLLQTIGTSSEKAFIEKSALLTEEELQYYVDQYARNGFLSTLNLYKSRKMDYDDELAANFPSKPHISHKSFYIGAAQDRVLSPAIAEIMKPFVPNLRFEVVEGAGHWILREQKEKVNKILLEWLEEVQKISSTTETN